MSITNDPLKNVSLKFQGGYYRYSWGTVLKRLDQFSKTAARMKATAGFLSKRKHVQRIKFAAVRGARCRSPVRNPVYLAQEGGLVQREMNPVLEKAIDKALDSYINQSGEKFTPPSKYIREALKAPKKEVKGAIEEAFEYVESLKPGTEGKHKSTAPLTESGKFRQQAYGSVIKIERFKPTAAQLAFKAKQAKRNTRFRRLTRSIKRTLKGQTLKCS